MDYSDDGDSESEVLGPVQESGRGQEDHTVPGSWREAPHHQGTYILTGQTRIDLELPLEVKLSCILLDDP